MILFILAHVPEIMLLNWSTWFIILILFRQNKYLFPVLILLLSITVITAILGCCADSSCWYDLCNKKFYSGKRTSQYFWSGILTDTLPRVLLCLITGLYWLWAVYWCKASSVIQLLNWAWQEPVPSSFRGRFGFCAGRKYQSGGKIICWPIAIAYCCFL